MGFANGRRRPKAAVGQPVAATAGIDPLRSFNRPPPFQSASARSARPYGRDTRAAISAKKLSTFGPRSFRVEAEISALHAAVSRSCSADQLAGLQVLRAQYG